MKLRARLPRRGRPIAGACTVLILAALLQLADVNPASSQGPELKAFAASADPGLDPGSDAWDDARPVEIPLTAQAGMYFAGGGSVRIVSARALHHDGRLFVRAEWTDKTEDGTNTRVQDFSDAVAVEFPAKTATSVPSICMGQADGGVNIWQWRADSEGIQAPAELYPNAQVDFYPSNDPVYDTARAAGNPMTRSTEIGPVQTLVARMFGTLSPAAAQNVQGRGLHTGDKWTVVFSRDFKPADADQAAFSVGSATDIAFAVWDGSNQERDGRKSVSGFLQLVVSPDAPPSAWTLPRPVLLLIIVSGAAFLAALRVLYVREAHRRDKGTVSG